MGWIIILFGLPFIIFILGMCTLHKDDRYILLCLSIFLIPITIISAHSWDEQKTIEFNKKYAYVTSIDYTEIKNIDWKIDYLNDIKWINKEIEYAKKNYDSFWFGIFTTVELTHYNLIDLK